MVYWPPVFITYIPIAKNSWENLLSTLKNHESLAQQIFPRLRYLTLTALTGLAFLAGPSEIVSTMNYLAKNLHSKRLEYISKCHTATHIILLKIEHGLIL